MFNVNKVMGNLMPQKKKAILGVNISARQPSLSVQKGQFKEFSQFKFLHQPTITPTFGKDRYLGHSEEEQRKVAFGLITARPQPKIIHAHGIHGGKKSMTDVTLLAEKRAAMREGIGREAIIDDEIGLALIHRTGLFTNSAGIPIDMPEWEIRDQNGIVIWAGSKDMFADKIKKRKDAKEMFDKLVSEKRKAWIGVKADTSQTRKIYQLKNIKFPSVGKEVVFPVRKGQKRISYAYAYDQGKNMAAKTMFTSKISFEDAALKAMQRGYDPVPGPSGQFINKHGQYVAVAILRGY